MHYFVEFIVFFLNVTSMKDFFGIMGVVLIIGCAVPYFVALWKKTAKPHVFSWVLWCLINAIIFAAQTVSGAGAGAWTAGAAVLTCGAIAAYALKYGEKDFTLSDWAIFLMALAALPLWAATKNPLWSVILVSVIDTVAFLPTLRKSWNKPHQEVALAFFVGGVGSACGLVAMEDYSFTNCIYPLVIVVVNTLFTATLLYRRHVLRLIALKAD
jgi:hypothetical protein